MLNFNDYFEDEYQFSLKDVSYKKIECEEAFSSYELKIADTLQTELKENTLSITFARDIHFEPKSFFKLRVAFDILLHLRDTVRKTDDEIDWEQELLKNPNPYLGNVVSRASHLIAEITASYGQQPLITPPNPVPQEDTANH